MSIFDRLQKATTLEVENPIDPKVANALLLEWRQKVTDPTASKFEARPDLHGMTAIEAALFGASGHDFGDGEFHYSIKDGREDLDRLLEGEDALGAAMSSGRFVQPSSLLATALGAQDGYSVKALLNAGAKFAEGEEPVRTLFLSGSPSASVNGDIHDVTGVQDSLDALREAGIDINAPIDGKPASFHVAEQLFDERHGYSGDYQARNDAVLYAAADAGLDFQERSSEGLGIRAHLQAKFEGQRLPQRQIEDSMVLVSGISIASREFRVAQRAAELAAQKASAPTAEARDGDAR